MCPALSVEESVRNEVWREKRRSREYLMHEAVKWWGRETGRDGGGGVVRKRRRSIHPCAPIQQHIFKRQHTCSSEKKERVWYCYQKKSRKKIKRNHDEYMGQSGGGSERHLVKGHKPGSQPSIRSRMSPECTYTHLSPVCSIHRALKYAPLQLDGWVWNGGLVLVVFLFSSEQTPHSSPLSNLFKE